MPALRIDVHHHIHVDASVDAKLNQLLALARSTYRNQEKIVMSQQSILDKIAASDTKIDAMQAGLDGIQGDIANLKEIIAGGGDLSAIEAAVDAIDAKITAAANRVADIDSQT